MDALCGVIIRLPMGWIPAVACAGRGSGRRPRRRGARRRARWAAARSGAASVRCRALLARRQLRRDVDATPAARAPHRLTPTSARADLTHRRPRAPSPPSSPRRWRRSGSSVGRRAGHLRGVGGFWYRISRTRAPPESQCVLACVKYGRPPRAVPPLGGAAALGPTAAGTVCPTDLVTCDARASPQESFAIACRATLAPMPNSYLLRERCTRSPAAPEGGGVRSRFATVWLSAARRGTVYRPRVQRPVYLLCVWICCPERRGILCLWFVSQRARAL